MRQRMRRLRPSASLVKEGVAWYSTERGSYTSWRTSTECGLKGKGVHRRYMILLLMVLNNQFSPDGDMFLDETPLSNHEIGVHHLHEKHLTYQTCFAPADHLHKRIHAYSIRFAAASAPSNNHKHLEEHLESLLFVDVESFRFAQEKLLDPVTGGGAVKMSP
ncbi:hypothetical protein QQP08_014001 [Theobroma cacao]|nr:hypothetical protein QQP08_014001 [Theobroma cacao]